VEGLIKNKIFLFSVVLNVALFIFVLASCSETQRQRQTIDKEMLKRLGAEEKLDSVTREMQTFEGRIDSIGKELEEEKTSHELTKEALLHEQLVSKAVREELNKFTKSRDKP
jgi:hypothetical protein